MRDVLQTMAEEHLKFLRLAAQDMLATQKMLGQLLVGVTTMQADVDSALDKVNLILDENKNEPQN